MHKRTIGVNCVKKHLVVINGKRHEIKTRQPKSIWLMLKEYINHLPQGTVFTRKQLLNYIYTVDVTKTDTAADWYKGYLNKLRFITTNKPGVYIKQKHIPIKLTVEVVRKASRDDSWRTWFIPLNERLGINGTEL